MDFNQLSIANYIIDNKMLKAHFEKLASIDVPTDQLISILESYREDFSHKNRKNSLTSEDISTAAVSEILQRFLGWEHTGDSNRKSKLIDAQMPLHFSDDEAPWSVDLVLFRNADAKAECKAEKHKNNGKAWKKVATFCEVKKPGRNLDSLDRKSSDNKFPPVQMKNYLQFGGNKIGIITDGLKWRIYTRELSHRLAANFFEVDFTAAFDSKDADSLNLLGKVLFSFISYKSFQDNVFINLITESIDRQPVKIENLKEKLKTAIVLYLDKVQPTKDLERDHFHDAVMLMYRLVFVLIVEWRYSKRVNGLSDKYLNVSLMNMVKKIKHESTAQKDFAWWINNEYNIREKLDKLFDLYRGRNPTRNASYEFPRLCVDLFDQKKNKQCGKEVINKTLSQFDLANIVQTLAYSNEDESPIDYSEFDIQSVADMYEVLINHEVEKSGKKYSLEASDDVKGKDSSFFTPPNIASEVSEKILWRLLKGKRVHEVFDTKILDPSCGSGNFLSSALNVFVEYIHDAIGKGLDRRFYSDSNLDDIGVARRSVVELCLYGIDKNPLATELTRFRLWLDSLSDSSGHLPFPISSNHIICGDSLAGFNFDELNEAIDEAEKVNKIARKAFVRYKEIREELLTYPCEVSFIAKREALNGAVRKIRTKYNEFLDDLYLSKNILVKKENEFEELAHYFIEFPEVNRFDAIIGNPPWNSRRRRNSEIAVISDEYKDFLQESYGRKFLDFAFLVRAKQSVRPDGGVTSFVLKFENFCGKPNYEHFTTVLNELGCNETKEVEFPGVAIKVGYYIGNMGQEGKIATVDAPALSDCLSLSSVGFAVAAGGGPNKDDISDKKSSEFNQTWIRSLKNGNGKMYEPEFIYCRNGATSERGTKFHPVTNKILILKSGNDLRFLSVGKDMKNIADVPIYQNLLFIAAKDSMKKNRNGATIYTPKSHGSEDDFFALVALTEHKNFEKIYELCLNNDRNTVQLDQNFLLDAKWIPKKLWQDPSEKAELISKGKVIVSRNSKALGNYKKAG